MKYLFIILLAIVFTSSCTNLKNKNNNSRTVSSVNTNSLLGITDGEGELTLFGIKWNDMYNQALYPSEVLKNPVRDLIIKNSPGPDQVFNNYEDLVKLIERNLTFRAKAVSFLDEVNKQRRAKKAAYKACTKAKRSDCKDKKTVMNPDQTTRLTNGAKEFLMLRYLNTYAMKMYIARAEKILDTEIIRLGNYKPNDREMVEILTSLSAALTLYDNYVLMVNRFEEDLEIARIFKKGIETLGLPADAVETVSRNSRKIKYRLEMNRMVKWIKRGNFQLIADEKTQLDKSYNYLLTYIYSTAGYKIFNTPFIVTSIQNFYKRASRGVVVQFIQDFIGIERSIANELSAAFGNTVGLVESRKGYLYIGKNGKFHKALGSNDFNRVSKDKRKSYHQKVREILEPGDILLEKTPFRLTDKFIPGHWGHVAVWTGTITDLKERGLWKYIIETKEWLNLRTDQKEYIEKSLKDNPEDPIMDRAVLEALRPGVQLNDLYHFFNVDDLAILKPKLQQTKPEYRKAELASIIANGFTHVLKDYDFNFDVRDTNKIVCSELAWHTYTDCHFKTQIIASRASINPDDVADAVFGDVKGRSCFRTAYIIHDGEEVDPKQINLDEALKSLNEKSSL